MHIAVLRVGSTRQARIKRSADDGRNALLRRLVRADGERLARVVQRGGVDAGEVLLAEVAAQARGDDARVEADGVEAALRERDAEEDVGCLGLAVGGPVVVGCAGVEVGGGEVEGTDEVAVGGDVDDVGRGGEGGEEEVCEEEVADVV